MVVVQVGAALQGVFLWHRLDQKVQLVSPQADLARLLDLSVKSLRKAVSNIGSGLFCRDFGVYMVVHQSGVVVLLVGLGVYTFSLSVLFVVPG